MYIRGHALLTGSVALALLCASSARGAVAYVDDSIRNPGDGLSWESPFKYLQDALAYAATPGHGIDEIHVAQGRYQPDQSESAPLGTGDRMARFMLHGGLVLRGGYAGIGQPNPDSWDPQRYSTTLSGDLAQNDGPDFTGYAENSYHVLYASFTNEPIELAGFVIRAGNADFPAITSDEAQGGGLHSKSDGLSLNHCVFTGNTAHKGGAFHSEGLDPVVSDCQFIDNLTSSDGTAIWSGAYSVMTVHEVVFKGNVSTFGFGSALALDEASATMEACTFEANSGGGAICLLAGIPKSAVALNHCSFIANTGVDGVAIRADAGGTISAAHCVFANHPLTVIRALGTSFSMVGCTFLNNSGNLGPGAVQVSDGSFSLTDCLFTGNSTAGSSGAMDINTGSIATIHGCSFVANEASKQAGAIRTQRPLELKNCSFESNLAGQDGGAVYSVSAATVSAEACVFMANSAQWRGGAIYLDGEGGTFVNCRFLANAAGTGGSLYALQPVQITNALFSGNSASTAAGLWTGTGSPATIVNTTFSRNSAVSVGAAITATSSLTLSNSILWGNSAGISVTEGAQLVVSTVHSVRFCCIQGLLGGLSGAGNIGDEPFFTDDDGDDNVIGTLDDNVHLRCGSSCIGRGSNQDLPVDVLDLDGDGEFGELVPLDLEGSARVLDCYDTGVARVDIGALEALHEPLLDDCNGNGIPDACDLATLGHEDCNTDGVPDECQVAAVAFTSGTLGPLGGTNPQSTTLTAPLSAIGNVSLSFTAMGDLGFSSENVAVDVNGVPLGVLWDSPGEGSDCPAVPDEAELSVSVSAWNDAVETGAVTIHMVPSAGVDVSFCEGASFITVTINYVATAPADLDGDGNIDRCDSSPADLNGDGDVDGFDLALQLGQWTGTATYAPCPPVAAADLNGDCKINGLDLAILLAAWG